MNRNLALVPNNIKLVFFTFKDSLLAQNQSDSLTSSALTVRDKSIKFLLEKNKFVSSANIMNCKIDDDLTMSFIYNRNNNGPSIEPCGTPHLISLLDDETLL